MRGIADLLLPAARGEGRDEGALALLELRKRILQRLRINPKAQTRGGAPSPSLRSTSPRAAGRGGRSCGAAARDRRHQAFVNHARLRIVNQRSRGLAPCCTFRTAHRRRRQIPRGRSSARGGLARRASLARRSGFALRCWRKILTVSMRCIASVKLISSAGGLMRRWRGFRKRSSAILGVRRVLRASG